MLWGTMVGCGGVRSAGCVHGITREAADGEGEKVLIPGVLSICMEFGPGHEARRAKHGLPPEVRSGHEDTKVKSQKSEVDV